MGKPSLETDFKLGPQPCSVNISLLQHKASGDSPEFVPSTVMPHLEQDDIEEKSSSWSTSPVMCTLSSVDQTSFDRQSEITNFLYPTPCYRGYGIQGHQGSASLLNPRPLKNRQKRIKIKHTNVTDRLLFLPHIPIKHFSVDGSQCNNKAKKCQQDVCDLQPECGTTVPSEDKTQKSTTMQGSHCQQARHKPTASSLTDQNGNAQHHFSGQIEIISLGLPHKSFSSVWLHYPTFCARHQKQVHQMFTLRSLFSEFPSLSFFIWVYIQSLQIQPQNLSLLKIACIIKHTILFLSSLSSFTLCLSWFHPFTDGYASCMVDCQFILYSFMCSTLSSHPQREMLFTNSFNIIIVVMHQFGLM